MLVLLDQNVPPVIATSVRSLRPEWEVVHVYDAGLAGASDQTIFQWAQERDAVVVTFDEDFADTRMFPVGTHAGVIRLRVWPTTVEETERGIARLLSVATDEEIRGSLIIIDPERIRIRRAARHG
jgi:predicted nuclease of predicted toxin-antitoxin system